MNFNEKLEEVSQDLLRARATYEAWWNLRNEEVRSKYTDTMNLYSEYFRVAIHSHFVAMLMALSRILDADPKVLGLPGLMKSLASEPPLPKEDCRELKCGLEGVNENFEKVRLLRDKVFAHHDKSYTHERAFEEAGLKPNDLKDLLERILHIINLLCKVRKMGSYSFSSDTEQDLLALLEALRVASH